MAIKNDPGGGGPTGAFADLLRLQTEFQARLGEETVRYLRRLQGALSPASPGTIVLKNGAPDLTATGAPGERAGLRLDLENLQRVHCVVTPQLTPLVSDAGTTWFPSTDATASFRIFAPGAIETLVLALDIPATLPPDTYRGALVLLGFREGALPVTVRVVAPNKRRDPGPTRTSRPAPADRRPRRRKS